MKQLLIALLASMAAFASAQFYSRPDAPIPGQARVGADSRSMNVRVDQNLGDYIPLGLEFKKESGETVELRDLIKDKPVLLLPIFYNCAGICSQELNSLIRTLNAFVRQNDRPGQRFDVVIFSIDHTEDAKLAKLKKATYLDIYKHKGTDRGWSFLTGSEKNVQALTKSIGFTFRRDPKNGTIVHPAALVVLTGEGQISQYFLSTEYEQKPMLRAIEKAEESGIGERDTRPFFLACINTDPHTGQVSVNVLNLLKTLGSLTVIALVGFILRWNFLERKGLKEGASKP